MQIPPATPCAGKLKNMDINMERDLEHVKVNWSNVVSKTYSFLGTQIASHVTAV
jgi:hypothetical protein